VKHVGARVLLCSVARSRALLGLLMVFLAACTASRAAPGPPLDYVERVLNSRADAGVTGEQLPLLIVLHGLGDSPERFLELFESLDVPVRIIAPRAPDPFSSGTSWFPIDDPQRAPAGILKRAQLLVELTDYLARTRGLRGRPVVTGFSQGGILSFALAAYHAASFQAAVPIAGSLLDSLPRYQPAQKGFRVTAFHGRDDRRIPYDGAERTVARLRAVGTEATLTGLAGVGHAIPPVMVEPYFAALRSELARAAR
jgi:phospholipase/carboxylesterase